MLFIAKKCAVSASIFIEKQFLLDIRLRDTLKIVVAHILAYFRVYWVNILPEIKRFVHIDIQILSFLAMFYEMFFVKHPVYK